MRLTIRSQATVRQQHLDRLRRDRKAARPLRAAFPRVEELRLELVFQDMARRAPAAQAIILHPPAPAFFEFPCPFADCDGLFDLTGVVNEASITAAGRVEGVFQCSGSRSHRHATKRPCNLNIHYTVTATHQPQP